MFRNALKRGMDFTAGVWKFASVIITDENTGIQFPEGSGTHVLFDLKPTDGDDLRVIYNSQYGLINVINRDTGGQVFRIDMSSGNIVMRQDGAGITVTSPDGSTTKTYGVRNDGTWGEVQS